MTIPHWKDGRQKAIRAQYGRYVTLYKSDMPLILSSYCQFFRFSEYFLWKSKDFLMLKNQTKNVLTNAGMLSRRKHRKIEYAVNVAKNHHACLRSLFPGISLSNKRVTS
jgi:hypothetical protein